MNKIKLVILEGNDDFASELREYFSKREDCEVVGVSGDGEEGIRLLTKEADAAVVSLFLKGIDGFAVLERLKALGKKIPIVATGNYSDDAVIARAIESGANYYLMKPVAANIVGERLFSLLRPKESEGKEERKKTSSLDERISNIFISIGIPPHIKGYAYLREGIKLVVGDPRLINNVTKGLYPVIGERFQTSASKVERAIRHAIEVAWNRGRIEAINAIFGARVYIGTEKPTNSEFIALVADKLLLESFL